jgi:hypothetical protein
MLRLAPTAPEIAVSGTRRVDLSAVPVARSQGHAGRALLIAAAGVALTIAVAFGISVLDNRGTVDVRLGDTTFGKLDAESTAEQIAEDGPLLLPDVASGDRDVVLQHLGDDPDEGWIALTARPPGVPRNCTIQWQKDDSVFRLLDEHGEETDDCDGREYPANGGDLETFPVKVVDGELDIDITAANRSSSTTAG